MDEQSASWHPRKNEIFVFLGCMMKKIVLHVKNVELCYLDYLGEV